MRLLVYDIQGKIVVKATVVVTFVGTLLFFPSPNVDFLLTEPPKNYHAILNPGEGGTGRTKESRSS